MFSVCLWGSHPDAGNDDFWSSVSFPTLDAALASVEHPDRFQFPLHCPSNIVAFFQVVTEDANENICEIHKVVANPGFKPDQDDDSWHREMQMEAGMLHGCDGYNEYEGC